MGQMQTYKWENIRNIEFKYVHYANDEYTNEGDPYATYKIIIETDSGQKIDRLLRDSLSAVKIICKKYYGSPHRWFE
jgi:transposase